MSRKPTYIKNKQTLLKDKTICKENRALFKEYLDYQEIKLKRINGLRELDEGNYKTLYCYLSKLRNINNWFENKPIKEISKEVLNKDLHFHCLRHSGITHYLTKKRWSSLEVQRLAGHSKISTTQIYVHINPQDLVNRMWE